MSDSEPIEIVAARYTEITKRFELNSDNPPRDDLEAELLFAQKMEDKQTIHEWAMEQIADRKKQVDEEADWVRQNVIFMSPKQMASLGLKSGCKECPCGGDE